MDLTWVWCHHSFRWCAHTNKKHLLTPTITEFWSLVSQPRKPGPSRLDRYPSIRQLIDMDGHSTLGSGDRLHPWIQNLKFNGHWKPCQFAWAMWGCVKPERQFFFCPKNSMITSMRKYAVMLCRASSANDQDIFALRDKSRGTAYVKKRPSPCCRLIVSVYFWGTDCDVISRFFSLRHFTTCYGGR